MKKKTINLLLMLLLNTPFCAAQNNQQPQRLFATSTQEAVPYRIPAITTCNNGDLIAVADYRYCHSDIGYGPVDLVFRRSTDHGNTWSEEKILADGDGIERGNYWKYAFGDCAIVADRTSKEVLVVCVGGKKVYFQGKRNDPNTTVCFRSKDRGKTWDEGLEITQPIYSLFDARTEGPVNSLFFSSGRIHQSRYVKIGKYYRLYAALCTLSGNFVVYSDDFGRNWQVLGDINESCCKDGDEVKCEELPDGSVIISSRYNGRMFNVFTFTDIRKAQGQWDKRAISPSFADINNACNGEILIVPAIRKSDNARMFVALQSVPHGPQRNNVGFFYKPLDQQHYTAEALAAGWTRSLQICQGSSAYSTMTLQRNHRIGFLWEAGPIAYNIDYKALQLEEITNNQFTIDKQPRYQRIK